MKLSIICTQSNWSNAYKRVNRKLKIKIESLTLIHPCSYTARNELVIKLKHIVRFACHVRNKVFGVKYKSAISMAWI